VLYEADIPLKQLMKLKVGDTLPLEMRADALVSVRCAASPSPKAGWGASFGTASPSRHQAAAQAQLPPLRCSRGR